MGASTILLPQARQESRSGAIGQERRSWGPPIRDLSPDDLLGHALRKSSTISPADLEIARRLAIAADEPLGSVLLAEGFIDQGTLADALSELTGLRRASAGELRTALARLSAEAAEDVLLTGYLPVSIAEGSVFYATADPAPWRGAGMGMPVAALTTADELRAACLSVWGASILRRARDRLRQDHPHLSAHHRLVPWQGVALCALCAAATGTALIAPNTALLAGALLLCIVFLSVIALKGFAIAADRPSYHAVSEIRLRDDELPIYSILVPVFKEIEVLPDLIDALLALDYPASKLDIKLILEQEDVATRCAVAAMNLPGCFETLVVPKLDPQTKPKALNYAMAFVRGTYLVIYDAEDRPEPDQLRQAVARFAREPENVACLQGRLSFFNHDENWLTRQFTIEYATLFDLLLPILAKYNLPVPLGGTSNHFRVDILREVGAWDAFNVTEDADLGVRFARLGFRVGVIPSTTYEEANCRLGNWLRQRSRWIKGWIQTWFVHMRQPVTLARELGWRGFASFQCVTAGIVLSGLLHPLCGAALIWKLATLDSLNIRLGPVDWTLAFLGAIVFLSGAGIAIASGLMALSHRPELRYLRRSLLTMPIYWLLISIGAWYAVWEFIRRPFHWQKTRHGISRRLSLR